MIKNLFSNNNYNDSIFNDEDYNSLIEEYNDVIQCNIAEKENNDI